MDRGFTVDMKLICAALAMIEVWGKVLFVLFLCDPGVDSASNRNEYQEYFLGVKAAGA